MKLTSILKFGIVNIVRKANPAIGQYLPLYESNHFKISQDLDEVIASETAQNRFKQILPVTILSHTGTYQPKFLVTKMQFNPQAEIFRIVTLRGRGLLTQQFNVNNIMPWSYRDMMAMSKWPEPTLPPFMDDEMIYINKILKQCYFFESDGTWNQQTISHPKLSLEARLNENDWFDRWQMY